MTKQEIQEDIKRDALSDEQVLYEQFKNWEVELDSLTDWEKARFLILLRAEQKTLSAFDKDIMDYFKNSPDFEKVSYEGITISKKTRTSISLLPEADLQKIRSLYPAICSSQNVLHQEKLSKQVREFLKSQPEAVEEVISVDAKALHSVTKDYTAQKLTTYIEVKGL